MKRLALHIIPLLAALLLSACGVNFAKYASENKSKSFPGSPSGTDVLSGSTNRSSKEDVTSPKLDPLSGAMYVKPPQIGNYGTVGLSIPFDTPKGRAGVQPQVGLSYSSSSGDGLVGIGWSLSTGLGVISRTTRHGELYYDYRDVFTFNGKRLTKVSGSSTSEIGTYRQEIEADFSRFEYDGTRWKVYDKSGAVTIFGDDSYSRTYQPANASKTYIWHFSRSEDLNGNFMTAVYDRNLYNGTNIRYLTEIRYTGNSRTGMQPKQFVKFIYKQRDDSYVSKSAGFVMLMDRMLDKVEFRWDDPDGSSDKLLWDYKMVYETSAESGRPALNTVTSGRNTTSPKFQYNTTNHSLVWQKVNNPSAGDEEIDPSATQYFEGDFNGDGISDMVFFNPKNGTWKAAQGRAGGGYTFPIYATGKYQGYDSEEKIQFFKGNVTGDYNGDGRSDIAFYLPETKEFVVAQHNGKTFDFVSYGKNTILRIDLFACEWFPGDFDGNGLSDTLLYHEPTGEWVLMRNTGGAFDFRIISNKFKHLYRSDFTPDGNLNSDMTSDASRMGRDRSKIHFISGDFNGDGRTDIGIYDERIGNWYVGENYRDEVTYFKLNWSLYSNFRAPEGTLFGSDRFSGDFNGDGRSDIMLFDRNSGVWWLGKSGDRSFEFIKFGSTPEFKTVTRWLQGDFNGDGRTDIGFYSKPDGNFWIGEATADGFRYRIYSNLSGGPAQGIIDAPPPKDEVVISHDKGIVTKGTSTYITDYTYNGSTYEDRGEVVFPGAYTGTAAELLIFNRDTKKLNLANMSGSNFTGLMLSAGDQGLETGRTGGACRNSEMITFYRKDNPFLSSPKHVFTRVYFDGNWVKDELKSFNSASFSIDTPFWAADRFHGGKFSVIAGDPSNGQLMYLTTDSSASLSILGDLNSSSISDIISSKKFSVFSGYFVSTTQTELLLVDRRSSTHEFYLGTMTSSGNINFKLLSGSANLKTTGAVKYLVENHELIYGTDADSTLYRIAITATTIKAKQAALPESYRFLGEVDNSGNPIVRAENSIKRIILGETGYTEETIPLQTGGNIVYAKIERSDLYQSFYAFRWIQGDYNGDGKTDIGLFHLKHSVWYFAISTGTVPDMLETVENGIGGFYKFEYSNSTSFDNTGSDGIPHLPMNYKVCTSMETSDGLGNYIRSTYKYARGYAFSDFINGYKETDYFGFSEFHAIDAYGMESVSYYNTIPYTDYLKNRALAGAVKRTEKIGSNRQLHTVTEHEYTLHQITAGNHTPSFLIEPTKVKTTVKGVPTVTVESHITLASGEYKLESRSTSTIDHYTDGRNPGVTNRTFERYETTDSTNETRLAEKRAFDGSSAEVTTLYQYDSRGNTTRETTSYTGSGSAAAADKRMDYEYDEYGNRTVTSDRSGSPDKTTITAYDDRLHQFASGVTQKGNSIDLISTYRINYEQAFGRADMETDPNGNRVVYEFDNYGRLLKQSADAASGLALLASYIYSTDFPLSAKVTQKTAASVVNNDGDIETKVYADGLGRTIYSVRSCEGGYAASGTVAYDHAGRVIRKGQPVRADSAMASFESILPEKNPTYISYDPLGRVSVTELPKTAGETETPVIRTTYEDPWKVTTINSVGRSKKTTTNGRGLALYVDEWGTGDDGNSISSSIGFTYDEAGRRIKKAGLDMSHSSEKDVATWKYDGFGRVVEESDTDRGKTTTEYDTFGRPSVITDARGLATRLTYDRMGRVVEKQLPDSVSPIRYYYDSSSLLDDRIENGLGKLVAIEEPSGSKAMSYDKLGRVAREKRTIAGVTGIFVTEYEYDLVNRKKNILYPEDTELKRRLSVTYTYGPDGVKTIYANTGLTSKTIVARTVYNEYGQIDETEAGGGVITNYEYDTRRRAVRKRSTVMSNGLRKDLRDTRYTFRSDDSIAGIEATGQVDVNGDYASRTTTSYQYDGLGRLIHANGASIRALAAHSATDSAVITPASLTESSDNDVNKYEQGYAYASNGNLTEKIKYNVATGAADTWSYTYSGHKVTRINSSKDGNAFSFSYDATGNMTEKRDLLTGKTKQMQYDSNNRIQEVTDATGTVLGNYDYDDQGFRVKKVSRRASIHGQGPHSATDTIEVLYPSMYFGMERQIEDNGNVRQNTTYSVNNIYLNGVRIAALTAEGETRFYLTDQVDSVSMVLSEQGKPLTAFEYMPYGETWLERVQPSLKEKHNPKYNSQELDAETDFYYYNARYYDPEISRFVTADTVIDGEHATQGWNRYMYVKGNPIRYSDPTGHWPFSRDSATLGSFRKDEKPAGAEKSGGASSNTTEFNLSNDIATNRAQSRDVAKFVKDRLKFTEGQAQTFGENSCLTLAFYNNLVSKGFIKKDTDDNFQKFLEGGIKNNNISVNGAPINRKKLAEDNGAKLTEYWYDKAVEKREELMKEKGAMYMLYSSGTYKNWKGETKNGEHGSMSFINSEGKELAVDHGWPENRGGKTQEEKPQMRVKPEKISWLGTLE